MRVHRQCRGASANDGLQSGEEYVAATRPDRNHAIRIFRGQSLNVNTVRLAWESYAQIPVRLLQIDIPAALDLASSLGLYAYDAYVLEAARATRAPLLTIDATLGRASRSIGLAAIEVSK